MSLPECFRYFLISFITISLMLSLLLDRIAALASDAVYCYTRSSVVGVCVCRCVCLVWAIMCR